MISGYFGPAAYVVTGHVVGSLLGGEVTLDYSFDLVDGLIARLEISPRR